MPVYGINSKEFVKLQEVSGNLVVEYPEGVSREELTSVINNTINGVSAKGFINDLIDNHFCYEVDGIIYFGKKEKGGEKVEIKEVGTTSGEEKVAKAILDHFAPGFKQGTKPSKMVFESCLKTALPSINKKVDLNLAMKVMVRGEFLKIEDEKVFLGEEGKEYLSL